MLADNLYKVAEKMLNKYSDDILLIKKTVTGRDTQTGEDIITEEHFPEKGYVSGFSDALIASNVVNFEDISILVKAPYIDASFDVEYEGLRYNIISIFDRVSAQNKPIIYKIQARK